jgi:YfiH family protein
MFPVAKKKSIAYLHAPVFTPCDFLVHAFCTRIGGVSRDEYQSLNISFKEGDEEFRVLANWDRLATAFEIPMENFLVLNQVHGDDVLVIKPLGEYFTSRDQLNYDAVVTNRPNLALCIKTADCAPIFLVDPVRKAIAAIHAGWRGTALQIAAKTARLMVTQYRSNPRDLLAAIGPSIGRCCYEVDEPAVEAFRRQGRVETFLLPGRKKNHWMLDLVEANRLQLLEVGLLEKHIETSGWCTTCNPDAFFSHRGSGGVTGRQVNFLMIKGEPICKAFLLREDIDRLH